MRKKLTNKEAHFAWAILVSYIVAYDIWAMNKNKPTLSHAFTSGMNTPRGKLSLMLVWFVVTKHLVFSKIFPKYDAIGWAASKYRGRRNTHGVVEWTISS